MDFLVSNLTMYLSRMTRVHKDRNLAISPLHLESVPDILFSPKLVFAWYLSWEASVFEDEVLSLSLALHSQNCSSEVSWTFPSKTSSTRQVSHVEMDPRLGDIIEKNTFWSLRSCATVGMRNAWSWLGLKHSTLSIYSSSEHVYLGKVFSAWQLLFL